MRDGSLAFTIAHTAEVYNLSAYGSIAYASGAYFGPNGEGLVACPFVSPVSPSSLACPISSKRGSCGSPAFSNRGSTVSPGQSRDYRISNATTTVWKVFARLAGLDFADDCVDFFAVVDDEDEGVLSAWEFL